MNQKTLLTVCILLLISLHSLPPLAAQDEGETMTFVISGFDTLDIHHGGHGDTMSIGWLLGSTLVSRDHQAVYHPWLATSWEASEDGMLWTFQLRDDVTFHDGRPLTADDFVWSITRLLDPETGAPQAGRFALCQPCRRPGCHHARDPHERALPAAARASFQHRRRPTLSALSSMRKRATSLDAPSWASAPICWRKSAPGKA